MTIREIASGGGIAFVVLTLVQIAPVKLNPWTWLARAIGRAINGDVLRKLDETRKILDDHIKTDDARNADLHRSKILTIQQRTVAGHSAHTGRLHRDFARNRPLRKILRHTPGI